MENGMSAQKTPLEIPNKLEKAFLEIGLREAIGSGPNSKSATAALADQSEAVYMKWLARFECSPQELDEWICDNCM